MSARKWTTRNLKRFDDIWFVSDPHHIINHAFGRWVRKSLECLLHFHELSLCSFWIIFAFIWMKPEQANLSLIQSNKPFRKTRPYLRANSL